MVGALPVTAAQAHMRGPGSTAKPRGRRGPVASTSGGRLHLAHSEGRGHAAYKYKAVVSALGGISALGGNPTASSNELAGAMNTSARVRV